ncbi:grasp-with-spasm system SPASM domain peptide maturase [Rhizosphaericola mali]|uniref:Grasp-with-spasm system SPASM domain peptide maturase n=1 Tax=Rhizosphaericola mali TaxID=2545455 RepID=A0A5P2FZ12_9BACT|nr:grasp-with-spasm system SPASM domain peptide maturase [Rhizosphaericola mali]QES87628.1 grasp-with-spasm system SPASM domain peptide maturase [Rhizosphaericola mali]
MIENSLLAKYIYIYSDCFLVRGANRSLIYDISKRKMIFIDNQLYNILKLAREYTIGEILEMFTEKEDINNFEKILKDLINTNLCELVEDIKLFPPIEIAWEHPSIIQNAIIDIRNTIHDFEDIFNELDELGCYHIQIRIFSRTITIAEIQNLILNKTKNKKFRSINLTLPFDKHIEISELRELVIKFPFIQINIYDSKESGSVPNCNSRIIFVKQNIQSCNNCGIINLESLNFPSIQGLMHNILFNGCLNRKISIDENGNIKNCPSMNKDYGKYGESTFKDILLKESFNNFKKYWYINKDEIEICKDCEFRYLCSDCRAYTADSKNILSKPEKCKYNPYTSTWEK